MDPQILQYVREGVLYLVALVLSICVHEFGHAFVADRLGDRLPRAQGRVTLNPLAHADPFGTILMPILAFVTAIHSPGVGSRILGWGRPVQVSMSPAHITRRISLRTARALIAIAGPLGNIVFALVLTAVYAVVLKLRGEAGIPLAMAIYGVISMNIGLCLFNLIPCPPLDGGAVLRRLLPRAADPLMDGLERYGMIVLFVLLMSGALAIITRPAAYLTNAWMSLVTGWIFPG